jgi:hypothetical protein
MAFQMDHRLVGSRALTAMHGAQPPVTKMPVTGLVLRQLLAARMALVGNSGPSRVVSIMSVLARYFGLNAPIPGYRHLGNTASTPVERVMRAGTVARDYGFDRLAEQVARLPHDLVKYMRFHADVMELAEDAARVHASMLPHVSF